MPEFSYSLAFDRNIGWVTEWEQQALRGKRVAIAGMGGVGGVHMLTLARLGIGSFHISDMDRFDLVNFNRQIGAMMSTLGHPKTEVLEEMALDINPELRIRRFDQGVTTDNIDAFLDGIDLFVDGFDFFVLDIRRRVFARCAELGIPAVTAAPIGMGVGFLAFDPKGMSFEEYFRLDGQPEVEQYLRFLMGVAPRGLHRAYLVDPSRIDLARKRGPSTVAACQLCAGVVGTAAVKLLLRRGEVRCAPWHHHYDAYRERLEVTRLPLGNAGPLQRAKLAAGRRMVKALADRPLAREIFRPSTPVEEILNLARWAPSGDNVQPWRFRITGKESLTVHLIGETGDNIYEIRGGEPNLLSGGMLLETMRIAATTQGRSMSWHVEGGDVEDGGKACQIAVRFVPDAGIGPDRLASFITMRSVDRRPFRQRPLTDAERRALEATLDGSLAVDWHASRPERLRLARLSAKATDIRLRTPEAHRVHQEAIDWRNGSSATGIPATAIGLARATLGPMRWAMRSWTRMERMNRLGGTTLTAAQLDYRPGLGSAAYFILRPLQPLAEGEARIVSLLRLGECVQRFWLTATRLGLAVQPNYATLVFAHYGEQSAPFTRDASLRRKAGELARAFRELVGAGPEDVIFLGRIGQPRPGGQGARSSRRPLPELMGAGPGEDGPAPDDTEEAG